MTTFHTLTTPKSNVQYNTVWQTATIGQGMGVKRGLKTPLLIVLMIYCWLQMRFAVRGPSTASIQTVKPCNGFRETASVVSVVGLHEENKNTALVFFEGSRRVFCPHFNIRVTHGWNAHPSTLSPTLHQRYKPSIPTDIGSRAIWFMAPQLNMFPPVPNKSHLCYLPHSVHFYPGNTKHQTPPPVMGHRRCHVHTLAHKTRQHIGH